MTGGVSKSMSSGYGATVSFTVPAYKTVNCDRGIITQPFSVKAVVTTKFFNPYTLRITRVTQTSNVFTGLAPSRAQWRIF
ncbi:hypothetical protein FHX76_000678 [Lysinibacter cavernae]|uniref:Uncharacterized protein n=1 Tax=Lysinibacter cavernae TaxID=1640652 RepID=A0A7X5TSC0_9MICO|nr:hypothetical protein [Lysinibacter cavernae]